MRFQNKLLSSVVFLFLSIANVCFALNKEENPFLGKEFWKEQPSIVNIEENIAKGFSITESNIHGFDAVCYAILEKNPIATIDYLLSKGNDVNKITHDARTYIFWATYKGNLELMKHLVAKGAKTDLVDSHGYSLLNFAAVTGQTNTELYDFCIAQGSDILNEKDHYGRTAILASGAKLKDLKILDYFIGKGLTINDVDKNGNGIFHHAAKGGNVEVLKSLVEKGVSTKVNPKTNENAFLFATLGGRGIDVNKEAFLYLESLGLNPNIKSNEGVTPLHNLAWASSNISHFEYFINKGVNVSDLDNEGNNALLKTASWNDLGVVTFLAEKTNDINTANKDGETALMKAVKGNSVEVLDYLISKKADLKALDKKGNSAVTYLIEGYKQKEADVFEKKKATLEKAGLDLTKPQAKKSTVYHLAIEKNSLDLLKNLESLNVDVNAKDNQGNTALHYAAMKSKGTEILKYLVDKGANKKIKTDFDETVYDLAAENELLKGISLDFLK